MTATTIRKTAIDEFLRRPRADLRRYQQMSEAQLDALAADLPVAPPIWTSLRLHQKAGFVVGARLWKIVFHYDTGTGKTKLAIALARYFQRLGVARQILVLVPKRINRDEWAREVRKHSRQATCLVLSGTSQQKWKQLEETDALLVIETYAGLVRMVCEMVKVKGRKRKKLVPQRAAVSWLTKKFQGFVADESHLAKSKHSLAFRVLRQLSKTCPIAFPMSGTPFGKDPQDLWSQMFLVDQGLTLGKSLGLYRAAFFNEVEDDYGRISYSFDRRKQFMLNRCLAHRSLQYEADAADLPKLVPIVKKVTLPQEADTYYRRARDTIIASGGKMRDLKNAFLRMRQISSGFVGYHDDDSGARAEFEFEENPKLDMLIGLIETIRPDRKIVVYHDFIYSGNRIAKELKENGIGYVLVNGSTKDTEGALHRFDRDSSCRVMLLSNKMAIGLNLQVAQYLIYYESPVSVIERKQSRRRVERQESKHSRVFMYDLVATKTDQSILAAHRQGSDLFDAILRGRLAADTFV